VLAGLDEREDLLEGRRVVGLVRGVHHVGHA
jgi:hypothetical protein